jgi:hypothetical protein
MSGTEENVLRLPFAVPGVDLIAEAEALLPTVVRDHARLFELLS